MNNTDIPRLKFLLEILENQGSITLLDGSTGKDGSHINMMINAFMKNGVDQQIKLPDCSCRKIAATVTIDKVKFSPEVKKKLDEAKEMMESFADFDIHDSVYVNFMAEVLKPSFSARAIKGIPAKSARSDNLARDLILFDPVLMEEYMNRGKRKISAEESNE